MHSRSIASFALGVFVVGVSTLAPNARDARAQPAPPAPPSAKQRIVIDRATVKPVTVRAAIAHVPFPIVDPQTSKPVAPSAIIVGPKGEQVTAQAYWDDVNKFEKYLNDRGLSLRTAAPVTKMERLQQDDAITKARAARMLLVQQPVSPAVAKILSARRAPLTPVEAKKHADASTLNIAAKKPGKGATVAQNKTAVVEKEVHLSWQVDAPMGGDKFGADFAGDARVDSTPTIKTVAARASASGTVFGKGFQIADAHAMAKSVYFNDGFANGTASVDVDMTAFGDEAFPPQHLSGPVGKPELYSDRHGFFSHDYSPDFPSVKIGVGPFDVEFTVAQSVHVDLDAAYKIAYSSARIDLIPHATLDVAIRAAIGLAAVELGVDGKVRVFDSTTEMTTIVDITDPGPETKLVLTSVAVEHLDTLKGTLSAFAKVGWCPFCHTFDVDIFSAGGAHEDDQLLNVAMTIPLMPPPPPPPPRAPEAAPAPSAPPPRGRVVAPKH